ncbi:MAG: YihY/virulence factor BrkB family protein, partial [Pseudomonadota bacterium]
MTQSEGDRPPVAEIGVTRLKWRLLGAHPIQTARTVWGQLGALNHGLISAGVAFYGLFAVFPGLAAMIAIWGLVADPGTVDVQLDSLRQILPAEAYAVIDAQVANLVSAAPETLGWATGLSILLAIWSTRAGVSAVITGLNAIYGRTQRSGIWHTVVSLAVTVMLVSVGLVAVATMVVTPVFLAVLPLGQWAAQIVEIVRWATALTVIGTALTLLYRFGPRKEDRRPGWFTPGAVLVLLLWTSASVAYTLYISNFNNYNEVYGSIG